MKLFHQKKRFPPKEKSSELCSDQRDCIGQRHDAVHRVCCQRLPALLFACGRVLDSDFLSLNRSIPVKRASSHCSKGAWKDRNYSTFRNLHFLSGKCFSMNNIAFHKSTTEWNSVHQPKQCSGCSPRGSPYRSRLSSGAASGAKTEEGVKETHL